MTDPSLPPVLQPSQRSTGQPPAIHERTSASGFAVSEGAVPEVAVSEGPGESSEGITHNRPLVFAILFGVTGALGLPLLWFSPAFTTTEKWLWSTINILYTLGLIAIAIAALRVIFDAMQQF